MRIFLDSSAYAKRFVEEEGSAMVTAFCEDADDLGLSILCLPEIMSALNRLKRNGTIDQREYALVRRHIHADLRDADIVNLTGDVIRETLRILEHSHVRTAEALPIACAVLWDADLFVSANRRQLQAAGRAGLSVRVVGG
ncbi:MAG: type II toxin-antitoxin system VapC family toxin [Bacteroidetes bacterium]|nr:type II toxin-antitoxin system VapC family toxin [Bacteroidota bacterium]